MIPTVAVHPARIVVIYSAIAAIATLVNIATQALVVLLYSGAHAIALSVLAGTAVGLPLKYILEKRYIFVFKTEDLAHDGRVFFLYTVMGVITTAIFWSVEYLFHSLFNSDAMRYLGGAIGLTIGYYIKYRLDKKYVFVASRGSAGEST